MNYEELKKYPFREIEILTDTMNEVNTRKGDAINNAKSGGAVSGSTIGNFS